MLIISITPLGFGQSLPESGSSYFEVEMIFYSENQIGKIFLESKYLNPEVENEKQILPLHKTVRFLIEGVIVPLSSKNKSDTPESILRNGISKEYWFYCREIQESLKTRVDLKSETSHKVGHNLTHFEEICFGIIALVIFAAVIVLCYMFFNKKKY